jgi:hypothetical protein
MTVGSTRSFPKEPHLSKKKESGAFRQLRAYSWSVYEQQLYLAYITANVELMKRQEGKRKRVFVWMARIITTRTSPQIKSHHQKLERKYRNVEGIIRHLQRSLQSRLAADAEKRPDRVTFEAGVQCGLKQERVNEISEKFG